MKKKRIKTVVGLFKKINCRIIIKKIKRAMNKKTSKRAFKKEL